MNKECKWLDNYLYFIGLKYPYVLCDLLESYILNERDINIIYARYIGHKNIKDIATQFHLSEKRIEEIKNKVLFTLLDTKLN